MSWSVYLVRCADRSLYTGIARDPDQRVRAHNRGAGATYTRSRRPVRLVYREPAADRAAALRREYAINHLRGDENDTLIMRQAGAPAAGGFTGFRPQALTFLLWFE